MGFDRAIHADESAYPYVVESGSAGIIPYYAGPRNRLVDIYAITDPLLSRLPCSVQLKAGHCIREVPQGYHYFVQTGNPIQMDSDLAAYAIPLYKIKTLPLFSWERIKLLVEFTFGKFDAYRQAYINKNYAHYYHPGDAIWLFHRAYQETILRRIFPPLNPNTSTAPYLNSDEVKYN